MIVVKLMDGLGNQMFQYAYARFLQVQYNNEEIVFETTKLGKKAVRKYGLSFLNITNNCRVANIFEQYYFMLYSKIVRIIAKKFMKVPQTGEVGFKQMIEWGFYTTEDPIQYYPFKRSKRKRKFVRGYFQSPKYFDSIQSIIKSELLVNTEINERDRKLIDKLQNCQSVCMHIRRGDYIGNVKFDICSESYYQRAMNYCIKNIDSPKFFIFSNTPEDIEWIKNNYHLSGDVIYVNYGNNEFDDLRLMYNCKHFIISNSTYSWWAAYLSNSKEKITIAPSRWYRTDEDTSDIFRDNWILIDV